MEVRTRKTASLFGKEIRSAIKREEPWTQSQDLPNFLPFYVDRGQLLSIRTNSSELIVGRRGTGKTHLLGSLEELVSKNNEELAVLISIMECAQTPPMLGSETTEFASKRIAREMFLSVLREFLYQFSDKADAILKRKSKTMPRKAWNALDNSLNDLFARLLSAVELGKKFSIEKTSRETIKQIKNKKANASGDASLKVGSGGISGGVNLGLGVGGSGNIETEEETEIQSVFHIDLKEVRNLTVDIIKKLEIDRLYILIDEWMELEKVTPSAVQPLFAQMLKITFFNEKRIAVKIASVWAQTTLYDRQDMGKSNGIQLGQDILRGPDLDIDFLKNENEIHEFCKELIYRRLRYACPELERFVDRDGTINEMFITELFDNKNNFNAFIAATHGIPRQLMLLFMKCAAKINSDFEKHAIDYKLVSAISTTLYREHKRKTIDPVSTAQKLLDTINEYMETKDRRTFLVKSSAVSKSTALRKLVDEEHIHQVPSASTPRVIRDKYKAFHIDFGNYADWIESRSEDISVLLSVSVLPVFGKEIIENIDDYLIDVSVFEEGVVDCSTCGHSFLKTNRIFMKFNSCPRCAEEVIG